MAKPLSRPSGMRALVAGVAFVIALQWAYETKVAPLYSYAGLTYRDPVTLYYALAIAELLGLALILPRRIDRPSAFMLWLILSFAVAPCLLVSQYNTVMAPGQAARFGFVVTICFALIRFTTMIRVPRLPRSRVRDRPVGAWLWVTLSIVSIGVYLVLAATAGIHLRYLAFSDVYSVRADFAASAVGFPLIGYLLPLQYGIINPLFMAFGITQKRSGMVTAGILGQLIIYSAQGQKSVLFSIPAILLTARAFRNGRIFRGADFLALVAALIAVCAFIDNLTGSGVFTSLFTRRTVVVSGILATAFGAIFAHLPKTHYSEFLPTRNPYPSVTPNHIVGQLFVGNANTNANVSWLGHGYVSWGYGGMIVESLLIAALLIAADVLSRGLPLPLTCSLFFTPALALTAGSAFTAILTNGFAAALIIVWRLPRPAPPDAAAPPTPRRAVPAAKVRTRRPSPKPAEPIPVDELPEAWRDALGLAGKR